MKNDRAAFKILPDEASAPNGYQKISCHMIVDVKMEDFRRKARLVARGHRTEDPPTVTYASVVSRETVCLALTIAALNDLEVKFGDGLNAYITKPITEKVWTIPGPEFEPDAGKSALIVRALYGLKSAGAAFRAHLASFMQRMGYTSCKASPDLWLKAETRPDDNFKYYPYILCYVDRNKVVECLLIINLLTNKLRVPQCKLRVLHGNPCTWLSFVSSRAIPMIWSMWVRTYLLDHHTLTKYHLHGLCCSCCLTLLKL
jgi:hypothetical protein